ncbi:MAG: hypothetical protein ACRD26_02550 [Vicinamibacterales bacterium]
MTVTVQPPGAPAGRRQTRRLALAAAAAFVLTALVRFLALTGFPNDHFLYLAPAQQMQFGEWPSRDFVDPGTPLMYLTSAAAHLAVGAPLLGEALVVSFAFGLAAALTLAAAFRASGLLWIALLVTAVEVAMFPRSYHYPKLLLHAAGLVAMWRYVDAPSRARAALVSACVAVAFLFRHDLAVYLGAAGLVAAVLARPGWRDAIRRAGHVVLFGFLFVAPYLVYVETTTGLAAHLASGLGYSRRESVRTLLALPRFNVEALASADNARVWLFYTFHLLPLAALALVGWRAARRRSDWSRTEAAQIVALVVLAITANLALLRHPLQARLPDVAVPACVLAAWLAPRAWRAARARVPVRLLVMLVTLVSLAGVHVVGAPVEQLNRAGILAYPGRVGAFLAERRAELRMPIPPRQLPSQIVEDLVPFIEYVSRCTETGHRLFIAGEAPEIYVFARRRFAGGQPALRGGFFDTTEDQRRLVSRLRRQQVPLALVIPDSDAAAFPLVMRQVEMQFRPLAELPVEGRPNVLLRVSRVMTPRGVDAATGFPCFR